MSGLGKMEGGIGDSGTRCIAGRVAIAELIAVVGKPA